MSKCKLLPPIVAIGEDVQCGTYILRIELSEESTLRFGRFKQGKFITLLAGEYLYLGSALSTKGSTSLARRLIRHATRSRDKPPHRIRAEMINGFKQIGLGTDELLPKREKKLHWHVDYLLDLHSVEILTVFIIRSEERLEASLGRFLADDLHTFVFEAGLGANDVPGNTHLLRVEADGAWWRGLMERQIHR